MFEIRDEFSFDYRMHEGSALKVNHHFGGDTKLPVAIQTWVIPPGGFEGFHRHEGLGALTEFYQVLSGSARMRIGKQARELRAGDSALAPAGVDHDLVNSGNEELRVLVVWGPPGRFEMSMFGSHQKAQAARSTEHPGPIRAHEEFRPEKP
ncbi:cupin domain-containing protein [Glutamicibacter soli]|uniref:cupin domain-containing protein n=1 Tax=Glutamicibacter soli TaxID=453836 RepID=UPI003C754788